MLHNKELQSKNPSRGDREHWSTHLWCMQGIKIHKALPGINSRARKARMI